MNTQSLVLGSSLSLSFLIGCADESVATSTQSQSQSKSQVVQVSSGIVLSSGASSVIAASSNIAMSSQSSTGSLNKVLFDNMSLKDGNMSGGEGLWFGDDDHTNQGTAKNLDKNGNSVAQGLETSLCLKGAVDGVSACYVGWNLANGDAYEMLDGKAVLSSQFELSSYINPTGWGWTSAGWVAQFKGKATDVIPYGFKSTDTLEIALKYPVGKSLIVKAYEQNYVDVDVNQRPNLTLAGTGEMKVYKLALSQFKVASWAKNKLSADQVYRIGIFRQAAAAKLGEAMKDTDKGQTAIAIQCLGLNGGCSQ